MIKNNLFKTINLLFLFGYKTTIKAWPDGAPCVHAVLDSMNPLEAIEHQGGLQVKIN